MDTHDIAVAFRRNELQNRVDRRRRLLAQLKNEGELWKEELTPAEKAITEEALAQIYLQNLYFAVDTEVALGYWKRLWYALINKHV